MKIVILLCGASLAAQTRTFPLESLEGLKLHHVAAARPTKGVKRFASPRPPEP